MATRDRYGENKKPLHELKRPRRRLGDKVRELISCPLCWSFVRVVAWRDQSARVECRNCGFRFTVELEQIPAAMRKAIDRRGDDPDLADLIPDPTGMKRLTTWTADYIDKARQVYPGSGRTWTPKASREWPADDPFT